MDPPSLPARWIPTKSQQSEQKNAEGEEGGWDLCVCVCVCGGVCVRFFLVCAWVCVRTHVYVRARDGRDEDEEEQTVGIKSVETQCVNRGSFQSAVSHRWTVGHRHADPPD